TPSRAMNRPTRRGGGGGAGGGGGGGGRAGGGGAPPATRAAPLYSRSRAHAARAAAQDAQHW
ncbi:hypothetical protein ACUTF1_26620, partial [Burkholderia pseudomallei]